MGPDEHFQACLDVARSRRDPWSAGVAAAADYRFAAEQLVGHRRDLRGHRKRVRGALRELSHRCKSLDSALRAQQGAEVRRSAGQLCLGLLTILIILMGWGDCMLVRRFIEGFQIIGKLEDSHVWLPEDAEPPESFDSLLLERTSLLPACSRRHEPEDEAFLWDSLQEG